MCTLWTIWVTSGGRDIRFVLTEPYDPENCLLQGLQMGVGLDAHRQGTDLVASLRVDPALPKGSSGCILRATGQATTVNCYYPICDQTSA